MKSDDELALDAYYGGIPGEKWIRATCPFCVKREGTEDKRRSFGVRRVDGYYHCFRCYIRGFIQNFGVGSPPPKPVSTDGPQRIPPPEEFEAIPAERFTGEIGWWSRPSEIARAVLQRRKVPPAIWQAAGIGYCKDGPYRSRIVVPILSPTDPTVWFGFSARSWSERAYVKYLYPKGMKRGELVYNGAALQRVTDRPVLITEGVFDALPFWPDAVACLGKPTRDQIPLFLAANRPLVVVLDGDAWLTGKALSLLLRHKNKQTGYIRLPPRTDPNDADTEQIKRLALELTA